jgi:hypothetical protein
VPVADINVALNERSARHLGGSAGRRVGRTFGRLPVLLSQEIRLRQTASRCTSSSRSGYSSDLRGDSRRGQLVFNALAVWLHRSTGVDRVGDVFPTTVD